MKLSKENCLKRKSQRYLEKILQTNAGVGRWAIWKNSGVGRLAIWKNSGVGRRAVWKNFGVVDELFEKISVS